MNVDEIKQKYPHPVKAEDSHGRINTYCVGGAFCMTYAEQINLAFPSHFPAEATISIYLRRINPELDYLMARHYADMLTRANDRGDFEQAWWYLDRALNYTANRNLGI